MVAATLSFIPDQHPLSRNITYCGRQPWHISAAICRALPHRIVPRVHAAPGLHKLRTSVGRLSEPMVGIVGTCLCRYSWAWSLVLVPQHSRRRRTWGPARRGRYRRPFSSASDFLRGSRCGNRVREIWPVGLFVGSALVPRRRRGSATHRIFRFGWSVVQRRYRSAIALVSIANQSVFTAVQSWIARDAELACEHPHLRIFVINAGLVGMGLALLIAQITMRWPVMIALLLLNPICCSLAVRSSQVRGCCGLPQVCALPDLNRG